jgi:hypothetical protein
VSHQDYVPHFSWHMVHSMRLNLTGMLTATLAATALALTACGSEAPDSHAHDNHSGSTPAAPAPSAANKELRLLSTAPPGSQMVGGTASLTRHGRTTVTAMVTGVPAGKKFMAHVHAKPCAEDGGGGHFKFDQNGPAVPPNEIHLALTADHSGAATATAEESREVGPEAKSLVVHDGDKKMLCADF